jgi:hypothetical protein
LTVLGWEIQPTMHSMAETQRAIQADTQILKSVVHDTGMKSLAIDANSRDSCIQPVNDTVRSTCMKHLSSNSIFDLFHDEVNQKM